MTLRAVFFDLDGTLLDTAQDLSNALNATLLEDGLPPLPFDEARAIVSEGSFALVKQGYQLHDEDPQIPALRQRLLDHYLRDLSANTRPFPGIESLIAQIAEAGMLWGIVTNKPWPYAEPLMQNFRFAKEPSCLLCPEHVQHRKPDPESLFLACTQTDCHIHESIYIGDHRRDIECGKRAGMRTVAVTYGYIPVNDDPEQWGADHCVDDASELWPLIANYR